MMTKSLQFLVFIILLSLSQSQKCFEDYPLEVSEGEVISEVTKLINSKTEIKEELIQNNLIIKTRCLELLISRGFMKAANELYQKYFQVHQIKLSNHVRQLTEKMKADLEQFQNAILYNNLEEIPTVQPVYQWGQSKQLTLIYLKFANRIDSPAYVNIKNLTVNFTNTTFYLSGLSIQSHRALRFELNISLYQPINVSQSNYYLEAVGTMVINMTKTEEGIWRRLATDDKLVSVWWEARSKYPRDMDDYFELLENERIEREEEEEENHKKNKKKSKKKKKQRYSSKNSDDDQKKQEL